MENLAEQNHRRELQIARFEETLFETVKFEAFKWRGKYRYRLTNGDGRSITITTHQLFSQTETRIKIATLTMTVLPYMSQAEYGDFVKAVMDISIDIGEITNAAGAIG